jgi:hypothetical protein
MSGLLGVIPRRLLWTDPEVPAAGSFLAPFNKGGRLRCGAAVRSAKTLGGLALHAVPLVSTENNRKHLEGTNASRASGQVDGRRPGGTSERIEEVLRTSALLPLPILHRKHLDLRSPSGHYVNAEDRFEWSSDGGAFGGRTQPAAASLGG